MPTRNFALCRAREIARDPPYLLRASMAPAGGRTSALSPRHKPPQKRVCMTEQTLTAPIDDRQERERGFSRYQSLLIALLALAQFTIILDFIIISPLGALLMPALDITGAQGGVAVSAYAFSSGISAVLAAGFADRFDRKRFLLFFYVGFTLGTLLCALAPNYHLLLLGRIVTGLFGGVIGSVVLAIVTDLFALHLRGRVMGFV